MLPWLRKGIPELNIIPVDPVYVDSILLQNDERLKLSASEILVHGLSNYKIVDVNVDLDKLKVDLDVLFPKLVCTAKYSVTWAIIVLFRGGGFAEVDVGKF